MKKLTTDGDQQELDVRVARMSAAEYATDIPLYLHRRGWGFEPLTAQAFRGSGKIYMLLACYSRKKSRDI